MLVSGSPSSSFLGEHSSPLPELLLPSLLKRGKKFHAVRPWDFRNPKAGRKQFLLSGLFLKQKFALFFFFFNAEFSCTVTTDPTALQGTRLAMLLICACNRNSFVPPLPQGRQDPNPRLKLLQLCSPSRC